MLAILGGVRSAIRDQSVAAARPKKRGSTDLLTTIQIIVHIAATRDGRFSYVMILFFGYCPLSLAVTPMETVVVVCVAALCDLMGNLYKVLPCGYL